MRQPVLFLHKTPQANFKHIFSCVSVSVRVCVHDICVIGTNAAARMRKSEDNFELFLSFHL